MTYARPSGVQDAGDFGQILVPTAAALISAAKGDIYGLGDFAMSVAVTMEVVQMIKFGVDSDRPDFGSRSFPSGHTAAAFSGASYLHARYGLCYGLPAYAVATFVGFSRIYSERHHPIDVVGGAAIAVFFSFFFTEPYCKGVTVTPVITSDCAAVALGTTF